METASILLIIVKRLKKYEKSLKDADVLLFLIYTTGSRTVSHRVKPEMAEGKKLRKLLNHSENFCQCSENRGKLRPDQDWREVFSCEVWLQNVY